MKHITLDVTDHVGENKQINADTLCEWLDGLQVLVGRDFVRDGRVMLVFSGEREELITLIARYVPYDHKRIKTLITTIRD